MFIKIYKKLISNNVHKEKKKSFPFFMMDRNINNNIQYKDYNKFIAENRDVVIIDVRSPQEYREYHLRYAINIPVYEIKQKIEKIISQKSTKILVYCKSGERSKKTVQILKNKGYNNVYNIEGGIEN